MPDVPTNVNMFVVMRRSAHTRLMGIPSSALARWGGVAACLGGISYGAYGYFSDNPDVPRLIIAAVVPLLKLATPAHCSSEALWVFTPGWGPGLGEEATVWSGQV
jgi:hypothetical protein